MKQILEKEIGKLSKLSHVDGVLVNKFIYQLNSTAYYVKQENPEKHFCSFFLPVDRESRSIFLVHHKKANDWIPPGGHIEPNEHPIDTVKREFSEELSYTLTNEPIALFDLTVKDVSRSKTDCKVHFDFWYLVYTKKIPFVFLEKEFYDAGWFPIEKGVLKIKQTSYRNTVSKLLSLKDFSL